VTPSQIRGLRGKLKLSPDEFAEELRFTGEDTRITVWRWESGKRTPSDQTLILMQQLAAGS
jgi:DNA-binding transcriptional regulator YiaG